MKNLRNKINTFNKMSDIIDKNELYVPVKEFNKVCYALEKSNYKRISLIQLTSYNINVFDVIPIPRKEALLFTGHLNEKSIEKFLKEISAIKN